MRLNSEGVEGHCVAKEFIRRPGLSRFRVEGELGTRDPVGNLFMVSGSMINSGRSLAGIGLLLLDKGRIRMTAGLLIGCRVLLLTTTATRPGCGQSLSPASPGRKGGRTLFSLLPRERHHPRITSKGGCFATHGGSKVLYLVFTGVRLILRHGCCRCEILAVDWEMGS
jgi:hypothetical protein